MAYIKKSIHSLTTFIPEPAYPLLLHYLKTYRVDLTITKSRKSRYGDYSFDPRSQRHKISVNGTLNPYEFLITLLHELAHLVTFVQYQYTVAPHGVEWKNNFSRILKEFMKLDLFPQDILQALESHINNVKATQCRDEKLAKILQSYNEYPAVHVSDIGVGNTFLLENGEQYRILEKLRTRYKCLSLRDNRIYLFPGLYEVQPASLASENQ